MKVATWNVNGIRARCPEVRDWVARERPDVLCLQEIKAPSGQLFAPCDFDDYWSHWHGGRGYSGVSLQIRRDAWPEEPVWFHPEFDFEHRIAVARLGVLNVASVYVPNGGKDFEAKMRFLRDLVRHAAEALAEGTELVISGDLNVTRAAIDVHPKERRPESIGQLPEERVLLAELLDQGLVDVGRALDPTNEELFTWWAPWRRMRERNIGWRLDYILASEALATRATRSVACREVGTSDHAPVLAEFDMDLGGLA